MSVIAGSTVMVTGGCGFIGSHLVRRLLAEGARLVIALDSLRYGSEQNLAGLPGSERVTRVRFVLGSDEPALLDRHLEGVDHRPSGSRLVRLPPSPGNGGGIPGVRLGGLEIHAVREDAGNRRASSPDVIPNTAAESAESHGQGQPDTPSPD